MNTKTMRLPPRRVSMPNNTTNTNKRKEIDDFDLMHFPPPTPPAKLPKPAVAVPSVGCGKAAGQVHPVPSNQLLAGYLAHEFLTQGTLFGQQWGPQRSQPTVAESGRGTREEAEPSERSKAGEAEREPEPKPKPREVKHLRYVEVASLLKTDGAHLPGVVNPSQLARFFQM